MNESRRAIFLSYASQDADAARRICDALRGVGLEVWFDQSELRGGDAWDASIRKQIKECAFFIPIISSNTDAREEGYFRLEWKLAVDRTHLMADNKAFLVPVLLEGCDEASALVPEKFRERQWSRVASDESVNAFAARVAKLVDGSGVLGKTASNSAPMLETGTPSEHVVPTKVGTHMALVAEKMRVMDSHSGKVRPVLSLSKGGNDTVEGGTSTNTAAPSTDRDDYAKRRPRPSRRTLIAAGALGLAAAATGIGVWQPWRRSASASAPSDPELRRAEAIIKGTDQQRADVALAEDLIAAVLARRPNDVEATVLMARVQTYFLLRGYDRSEERFQRAKQFVDRALALDPKNPFALSAGATYGFQRRNDLGFAAQQAREAIALAPNEPYHHRMLVNILSATPGVADAEVLRAAKEMAARFPKDALAQYELGRIQRDTGNVEEAEKHFDLAIALGPIANAITARARLKLWVHGDPQGMKALLDTLPPKHRNGERAAISYFLFSVVTGEFAIGLDAVSALAEPWISEFDYTGPTKLLVGELLTLQGKRDLAMLRFKEAEDELSKRKPVLTRTFNTVWLGGFLAWRLGNAALAKERAALVFSNLLRPWRFNANSTWYFGPIATNLLYGERAHAIELMRDASAEVLSKRVMRTAMQLDPRMTAFRNDTEMANILKV
jgi:tetratricopeptide (TPR) repeat protein